MNLTEPDSSIKATPASETLRPVSWPKSKQDLRIMLDEAWYDGYYKGLRGGMQDVERKVAEVKAAQETVLRDRKIDLTRAVAELATTNSKLGYAVMKILEQK